ncbi:MAG TPA: hypothetical protein VGK19_09250 [Capsulimonadaceae bacterium]|jgi:hypothetical protein
MPKVSRPIVYTTLFAVVAGAVVFLTQPDAPPVKKKIKVTTTSHADANGITDEDRNAHFPRYKGGARDPFVAGVVPVNPNALSGQVPAAMLLPTGRSGWVLTGVNEINGAMSAVIENVSLNQSVFLKLGDTWNGLKVISIDAANVGLENALGQQTQITFAPAPDEKSGKSSDTTGSIADGSANPAVPSLSAITPLPPMPTGFSQRSRRRSAGSAQ